METREWSGWNREAAWGRKEGEGGVRSRGKEEGKQETCKIRTERGGDIVRSPMVAQRDVWHQIGGEKTTHIEWECKVDDIFLKLGQPNICPSKAWFSSQKISFSTVKGHVWTHACNTK
jgi:hypothetical protein